MKLLFDENLSPHLPRLLGELFPNSTHVEACGLEGQSDQAIWKFAVDNGFTIVSKDADFYERGSLTGRLPKVVWVRTGNCSRKEMVDLFTRRSEDIKKLESATESLLMIF